MENQTTTTDNTQAAADTQTQVADTQTQTDAQTQADAQTQTGTDTQTQVADTQTDGDLSQVTLQDGQGAGAQAQNDQTQAAQTQAPEINEEDYATKVTIDTEIAKDVEVDPGAMKAVAPLLKAAGVSVETAGKLVNALARYQIEQFKARQQERFEDNKRMHDAALQKYSKADFEQINAGIDFAFAKGGVMNFVVRNSEIGNDPEFLELMKWYGAHHPTDRQPAGGSGSGTTGQSAGFNGIAASWK